MVENVHLSKLIDMQARRLGNRVAIMYRDSCVEFWHEVAWNMLAQTVNRTANALLTLGIRPQQKIMIYAEKYARMPVCQLRRIYGKGSDNPRVRHSQHYTP